MASVFTKIVNGEMPGRFVWQDDLAVAFLTIAPLRPGHSLVVPREEIDQWTDADDSLFDHLMRVAKSLGQACRDAWDAPRAGVVIAGFEVPHLHVHVFPAWSLADFDFARVDRNPDPAAMDDAAERLRSALRALGHGEHVAG